MSTYVYNSTISTNTYSTEDYGAISSSVDVTVDYSAGIGLIPQTIVDYSSYLYVTPRDFSSTIQTFDSSPTFDVNQNDFSSLNQTFDQVETFDSSRYENFGYITDNSTLTPFGSLNITETAVESITLAYIGSGSLFEIQTLDENVTFVWVGNGTVFEIANGLESTVTPYLASGTLRLDGAVAETALESVTFDYNESSIYDPIFDYGLIAQNVNVIEDFGNISESPTIAPPAYNAYQDWGLITDINLENNNTPLPLYPFVPGLILSGASNNAETNTEVGSGVISTLSGAAEVFGANPPENTQLFNISNAATHSETDVFNASGLISLSGVVIETNTEFYIGSGICTIFDTAKESETDSYFGSGSLFATSGAAESFTLDLPPSASSGLFTIYGELIHPFIDYTPHITGSGSLFSIGVLAERFAFSYNSDSPCYDSAAESVDYGLLGGQPIHPIDPYDPIDDFYDYGFVYQSTGNVPDDFGHILSSLVTICPFGSITLFGTSLESLSAQTPENTQLFNISGSLLESNTESYVGVGTHQFDVGIFSVPLTNDNERVTFDSNYIYFDATELRYDAIVSFSASPPVDTQLFTFSSGYSDLKFIANPPENTQLFEITGFGTEFVSYNPPENTQLFEITGFGTEFVSYNPPENTQLFTFSSGYSDLKFIANPPENTQLFEITGTGLESYSAQTPENTQLFEITGTGLEAYSAQTPENTVLYTFSGELNHPFIDYTPSITGIGIVSISGTSIESFSAQTPENTQLFEITGTGLEAYSAQTPEDIVLYTFSGTAIEKNTESYVGIGTGPSFIPGIGFNPDSEGNLRDARTYSNRYPINDKVPGTGVGTITFDQTNQTAKYSPLTPWTGIGTIYITESGNEAFVPRTYQSLLGTIQISGVSSAREIAVYTATSSGTIFISQETSPVFVKEVDSYSGIGQLTINGSSVQIVKKSFFGSGIVSISGISIESFSAQTPENTQLFEITGTGLEAYSAQTPEDIVLYTFSSGIISENISKSYSGSGNISVNGTSSTYYVPNIPGSGKIRFISRTVDDDYDTVDSDEITSDTQDSANVSFAANPPENTQLFNIFGASLTSQLSTYQFSGTGNYNVYGGYENLKFISQYEKTNGLFNFDGLSLESLSYNNIGSGTLYIANGSSESYTINPIEHTQLFIINGLAETRTEKEFTNVGVGLFTILGSASTQEIAVYSEIGSGVISILGGSIIDYTPSPDGFGLINIDGSSNNSLIKIYDQTSGTLFEFSSALESFTKSTYVGIGTIYIQEVSGTTIENRFQIPRVFTLII